MAERVSVPLGNSAGGEAGQTEELTHRPFPGQREGAVPLLIRRTQTLETSVFLALQPEAYCISSPSWAVSLTICLLCNWSPDEMTFFVPATSLTLTLQLQTISDKPFIHAFSPVPFVQSHMRELICLYLPSVEGRREIFPPQGLRGEGGRKAYSCVRGGTFPKLPGRGRLNSSGSWGHREAKPGSQVDIFKFLLVLFLVYSMK